MHGSSKITDDERLPILMHGEVRNRKPPNLSEGDGSSRPSFFDGMIAHANAFRSIPDAKLRIVEQAYIYKDVVFTFNGSKLEPFEGTWREIDQPSRGFNAFLDQANSAFWTLPHRKLAAGFFLGSAGSYNYGHWLVDDLPRLSIAKRHIPADLPIIFSSFGRTIDKVKADSIRAISSADQVSVDPAVVLQVGRLTFVDPISFHPLVKSRVSLGSLVNRVLRKAGASSPARRLYVDRPPETWREVINRADALAFCQKNNFSIVRPETHSFLGQAAMFADADMICGIMGAAMTNVIFCRPDARVVFLAPLGWQEPFYWDLCDTIGLEYNAYFGSPVNDHEPPERKNFSVVFEVIEQILSLK